MKTLIILAFAVLATGCATKTPPAKFTLSCAIIGERMECVEVSPADDLTFEEDPRDLQCLERAVIDNTIYCKGE